MRLNLDSPILTALTKVYDSLYATLLFVLGCLPIVTIGASCAAMHATMMAIAAEECSGVWRKFAESFKENFVMATKLWGLALPVGVLVYVNLRICWGIDQEPSAMLALMRGLTIFTTALYAALFLYVFAGVSRFHVTIKQALSNALIWSMQRLHWTLCLLLITAAMAFSIYLIWFGAIPLVTLGLYWQARILNKVFGLEPEKLEDDNPDSEEIHYD